MTTAVAVFKSGQKWRSRLGLDRCLHILALWVAASLTSANATAGSVDPNNIATFVNGQPANATEVNLNFDELITQINDNHTRVGQIEATGPNVQLIGSDFIDVNCDTDEEGAGALQKAIDESQYTSGLLTINATGTCNQIAVIDRNVDIRGTSLEIKSVGAPPVLAQGARVILIGLALNADSKATSGLLAERNSEIVMLGVTVTGATVQQVYSQGYSTLFFLGANTIGDATPTTAMELDRSRAVLVANASLTAASLTLNSTGMALSLDNASYDTAEFLVAAGDASTQLTMSGVGEVLVSNNSHMTMGPASISTTDRFSVLDNSSVSVDESLFNAAQAWSLDSRLLIERNATFKFDMEDALADVTATHTGNIELGPNSTIDAFGPTDTSDQLSIGGGTGSEIGVFLNSTIILNNSTLATDTLNVLNGSFVFGGNAAFDDGQPAINVAYKGTVFDFESGILGTVTSCSSGGAAYDPNEIDVCP